MAEVLLFHHAQGLTDGVLAFADTLRAAGHVVHAPDAYEGRTFAALDDGIDYAREAGFGAIRDRFLATAEGLPDGLVYAGFSLGVMAAQQLLQTRPGAKGGLFFSAALPASEFGEWPAGIPAQIHLMEGDEFAQEDLPAAQELASIDGVELFLYPGDAHLFADSSLPDHDRGAADLLEQRTLGFLDAV